MELIIVVSDVMEAFKEYQSTGQTRNPKRRIIKIQVDLELKEGESVESISEML